ncbi:metalloregulator ArsR/SmtB family transcription factor [Candidatus Mycosynbacter amalyticus]|uniref:Metalloregulator ArsR/SmtB family transcription factor n=1 Tax=Candidatus Mycosynbacter amalyticus TaxID=2665156 RepID=A0A857MKJ3_9BACT|nr:metalloregulator ArsR/SmtB family transcription factor [Candidatus Mycosynbacter amalyticus]QHN42658.1 metalloregulator ArsR/SmtB family transcription factor [Candidatus Mycosynbacter amalyticus]
MEAADTTEILKSLADDTRLSVVRHLASQHGEVAARDITSDCALALKLSQPTMSHHFAKLVASGVLRERKDGVEKYYRLDTALLTQHGIDATKV